MKNNSEEQFNTREMIEIWNMLLEEKEFMKKIDPLPTFNNSELQILTDWIFKKPKEFVVIPVLEKDEKAVTELLSGREAQRRGMPLKMSSIYLRRIRFFKELIASRCNSAEAARRCGYSWKYAKQVGYRIRRSIYR